MTPLFLFASARDNGNTQQAMEMVVGQHSAEIVNLSHLKIGYFDYDNKNAEDDFIPLIKKLVTHDKIVFVSPVYWYSVSAQMKTFIDRLTDLMSFEKDLGHQLKGKTAYLITSWDNGCPDYYDKPLEGTCSYLGMTYKGMFDFCVDPNKRSFESEQKRAEAFAEEIFQK